MTRRRYLAVTALAAMGVAVASAIETPTKLIWNATASAPTSPSIGVSPSSLCYTATVGGSNPANQSISITNTGGGTLNWTASSNQSWLTVSPTSGTAPSTLTASASSMVRAGTRWQCPPV